MTEQKQARGGEWSCDAPLSTVGIMNYNIFYIIGVIVVIVVVLKLLGLY